MNDKSEYGMAKLFEQYINSGIYKIFHDVPLKKGGEIAKLSRGDDWNLLIIYGGKDATVELLCLMAKALLDFNAVASPQVCSMNRLIPLWKKSMRDKEAETAIRDRVVRSYWTGMHFFDSDLVGVFQSSYPNFLFWFRSTIDEKLLNGHKVVLAAQDGFQLKNRMANFLNKETFTSKHVKMREEQAVDYV